MNYTFYWMCAVMSCPLVICHSDFNVLRGVDIERDDKFMKAHPNATKKLPGAIIVGVKKGGTRALLEFLRVHPAIRATGPEVHFFDKHYHKGLDWYRDQMPPTLPHQLSMEKTPSYFITESAPRRIHKMSKDTKIILVVRDPVTRLLSDYAQALTRHPHMKAFSKLAFISDISGVVNSSWTPIRIGQYARHLLRWLRYFPPEQIHIVSGEDMINKPSQTIIGVQQFLHLPVLLNESSFLYNKTKGFPCIKKKKTVHCLADSKGRAHPSIDPFLIHRLKAYYRPFNLNFYKLTGRNFGWD